MSEPLRLLSIGAHPADIFDQSGGTMAHHAARGDFVACVVLTHGARVHDAEISEAMFHRDEIPGADELEAMMVERAAVKAAEVRRACDILGVQDLRFFDADDALLQVDEEMVRRLARLLREIRPDVILTHFPKERSYFASAHATAGQIALNAMKPGRRRRSRRPQSTPQDRPGVLLRHRRDSHRQQRLGRRTRFLQRRLRRHRGRHRQEAGRSRSAGESGVCRSLCP